MNSWSAIFSSFCLLLLGPHISFIQAFGVFILSNLLFKNSAQLDDN